MPDRGLGWTGSVFTVGTCRGLLLALLLEPSIVTTVSDIILYYSRQIYHDVYLLVRETPVEMWTLTEKDEGNRYRDCQVRNTCWFTTARTEASPLNTTYVLADNPLFPYRILFSPTFVGDSLFNLSTKVESNHHVSCVFRFLRFLFSLIYSLIYI